MIGFLKGIVVDIDDLNLILDVNGVGFSICCTKACIESLEVSKEYLIYIYMSVKEDDISLFGFLTKEEKGLFLKLLSVSGIGPKTAVGILSGISVKDLAICIMTGDVVRLSKIKGLGKKTAERIILELKEKIEEVGPETNTKKVNNPPIVEESIIALTSLGFTRIIAQKAVEKALEKNPKTMEEVLTYALQSLN